MNQQVTEKDDESVNHHQKFQKLVSDVASFTDGMSAWDLDELEREVDQERQAKLQLKALDTQYEMQVEGD